MNEKGWLELQMVMSALSSTKIIRFRKRENPGGAWAEDQDGLTKAAWHLE